MAAASWGCDVPEMSLIEFVSIVGADGGWCEGVVERNFRSEKRTEDETMEMRKVGIGYSSLTGKLRPVNMQKFNSFPSQPTRDGFSTRQ